MLLNFQFWKLEVETLRLNLMNHDSWDSICCSCNMYFTNLWTWLMTIIISRWLMWYGSRINLCFLMFYMFNSSFYMFFVDIYVSKIKKYKIYIFLKNRSQIRSQTGSFWKWSLLLPAPKQHCFFLTKWAPSSRCRCRLGVTILQF